MWASSPGFVLAADEAGILADALETASGMEKIQSNGFTIAGQKWVLSFHPFFSNHHITYFRRFDH